MTTIGLLHPGEMGASVGAAARANGARVLWASEGRGGETAARAAAAQLEDAGTLRKVVAASDVILSVCPPHAARDVAAAVAAAGFRGLYVDANAVAPATSREVAAIAERAGATYVDGGLIGPPPDKPGAGWRRWRRAPPRSTPPACPRDFTRRPPTSTGASRPTRAPACRRRSTTSPRHCWAARRTKPGECDGDATARGTTGLARRGPRALDRLNPPDQRRRAGLAGRRAARVPAARAPPSRAAPPV